MRIDKAAMAAVLPEAGESSRAGNEEI